MTTGDIKFSPYDFYYSLNNCTPKKGSFQALFKHSQKLQTQIEGLSLYFIVKGEYKLTHHEVHAIKYPEDQRAAQASRDSTLKSPEETPEAPNFTRLLATLPIRYCINHLEQLPSGAFSITVTKISEWTIGLRKSDIYPVYDPGPIGTKTRETVPPSQPEKPLPCCLNPDNSLDSFEPIPRDTARFRIHLENAQRQCIEARESVACLKEELSAAHAVCSEHAPEVDLSKLPRICAVEHIKPGARPRSITNPQESFFTHIQNALAALQPTPTEDKKTVVLFDHAQAHRMSGRGLQHFAVIDCSKYAQKFDMSALSRLEELSLVEIARLTQKLHQMQSVKIMVTTTWPLATAHRGEDIIRCLTTVYSLFRSFLSPCDIGNKFALVFIDRDKCLDHQAIRTQFEALCKDLSEHAVHKEAMQFFLNHIDKTTSIGRPDEDDLNLLTPPCWDEIDTPCTTKIGNGHFVSEFLRKKVAALALEYNRRNEAYQEKERLYKELSSPSNNSKIADPQS